MKKRLVVTLAIFALILISKTGRAAIQFDWTGAVSTDWANPLNWSVGGSPTALIPGHLTNDIVTIGAGTAYSLMPTLSAVETIAALTIGDGTTTPILTTTAALTVKTLTITGATLNLGGTFTITSAAATALTFSSGTTTINNITSSSINDSGGITISGGTVNLGSPTTASSTVKLAGTSILNLNAALSSTAITVPSGCAITSNSSGTITAPSIALTGTLTLAAAVNLTGALTANSGSAITTTLGGIITAASLPVVASTFSLGDQINLTSTAASGLKFSGGGTSTITATTISAIISLPSTSSGLVINGNSTVNLGAPTTIGGTVAISATSNLNVNAPLSGGAITLATGCAITSNSSGTITTPSIAITGTGALTVAAAVNLTGALTTTTSSAITSTTSGTISAATVTLGSTNTIILGAALNVTGALGVGNGNTITSSTGGTITAASLVITSSTSTPSSLVLNDVLNISGAVSNTSTAATLTLNAAGNTLGSFTTAGATLTFNGTGNTVGSITTTGNGAMSLNGTGTTTVSGALSLSTALAFTVGSGNTVTFGSISMPVGTSVGNPTQIVNSGTITCLGTIAMNGFTNITNTGNFNLGPASVINLSSNTASVVNTSPGVFTLMSDASSSATVGPITTGATFSGTGTYAVQRFITGGAGLRGYRLLSSPVFAGTDTHGNNAYSINYIANSCYITGTTVTSGGIDKAGNPTLYLFRENLTPSNSSFTSGNFRGVGDMFTGITNITYTIDVDGPNFSIPVGNGFLFFFRGDRSVAPIATETVTTYIPTSATLTATGTFNQGNITVKDWYTPTSSNLGWTNTTTPSPGNAAIQGYNLVGNPYPSSISWTSVYTASTNVGASIYEFNPLTNQYGAYVEGSGAGTGGFGDIIGSGQGFFTIASNASAVLNFTEATKSGSQPSTLLLGLPVGGTVAQQYLHLKMIKDTVNYDDVIIGFKPGTSTKYSINEDGLHLTGNSPPETLTALSSDSVNLSVNYLPLPTQTQQTVRLSVNATASGNYTFLRTDLVGIPALYRIWLKDNLQKDSLDLRANTTYAFNIDKTNPASFGTDRFQIVIRQDPALGLHLLNFAATKVNNAIQVKVNWTVENEANYTTFYVQRSTDNGKTFQSIGSLQADGSGTYTFIDKYPSAGQNQYRLQMSDVNNTITYSKVIIIQYSDLSNNNLSENIALYPNPAHDMINLSVTGGATPASYNITITNSSGTIIKTTTSSQPLYQNNVSDLLPGTYFIQVINNASKAVIGKSKFVKI